MSVNAAINLKNMAGSSPVTACCLGSSGRNVPAKLLIGQEPRTRRTGSHPSYPHALSCFPVAGPVWFSDRSFYERRGPKKLLHAATDIFGRRYELVRTPVQLTITEIHKGTAKGGNSIRGVDIWGFTWYFAHLQRIYLPDDIIGRMVMAGSVIGQHGNSGNAKTARCHTHTQTKKGRRFFNLATALNEVLEREGRRKESMTRCKKDSSKCGWCSGGG